MHINTPSRMNARTLITLTALLASGGYAFGACDSDASGGKVSVTSGSSCTAGYSSYAIANEYDSAAVLAQGPGSVLTMPAGGSALTVTSTTNTNWTDAFHAENGGAIHITAPSTTVTVNAIATANPQKSGSDGMHVAGDGSSITVGGDLDIAVHGTPYRSYDYGIVSESTGGTASGVPATVTIQGGTVTETTEYGGIGEIMAQKPTATSNTAVRAILGGVVNITGAGGASTTITTKGLGARGLYVSGTKTSTLPNTPAILNQNAGTIAIETQLSDTIQVGKPTGGWIDGSGPGIINAHGAVRATNNFTLPVEFTSGFTGMLATSYCSSTHATSDLYLCFLKMFSDPEQTINAALYISSGSAAVPSAYNAGFATSSGTLSANRGPAIRYGAGNASTADLHDYSLTGGFAGDDLSHGLIHLLTNANGNRLQLLGNSTATPNAFTVSSVSTDTWLIDATDATASLDVTVRDAAQITGMTRSNGSTINITLGGSGAIWTLKARASNAPSADTSTLTTLTLNAGGTLNASGDAAATSAAAKALGTRYAIAGNLTANGGQIALNTYLDAGNGTADAGGDVLKIDGNTSGSGKLGVSIADASEATDTTGDGILVLEVTGTSAAEFTLASPVIAAGRQYTLQRGTSSAATQKNWYLVSSPAPTAVPAGSALTWLLTGVGVALLAATRRRFGWRASR